jgi:hypothetical protein
VHSTLARYLQRMTFQITLKVRLITAEQEFLQLGTASKGTALSSQYIVYIPRLKDGGYKHHNH